MFQVKQLETPISFLLRIMLLGKVKAEKKYVAIQGMPLTYFYSYTFKKKKFAPSTPSEDKAEKFYFPIVPSTYNYKTDEIAIFAYCSPTKFKSLTGNLKNFLDMKSGEKSVNGRLTRYLHKVPQKILDVYTKPKGGVAFKVASSDKLITVDVESITELGASPTPAKK